MNVLQLVEICDFFIPIPPLDFFFLFFFRSRIKRVNDGFLWPRCECVIAIQRKQLCHTFAWYKCADTSSVATICRWRRPDKRFANIKWNELKFCTNFFLDICNTVDSFQKSFILCNYQQCMSIRNIVFTATHYTTSVGIFRHHSHTYMCTQWVAHSHAHMEYEILDGKYANVCEYELNIRTLWADERKWDNTSVSRARTIFFRSSTFAIYPASCAVCAYSQFLLLL